MTSKIQRTKYLALAASSSVAVLRAWALEPSDVLIFSKGPVSLRPQLTLSETYNDNLFSQPDAKEDFVTTVSPGLNLQLGTEGGNLVALIYRFNRHFYADRSSLNSSEHLLTLRNRLQGRRLSLIGNDEIQFLSSPIGRVQEFATTAPPPAETQPPGGTSTPQPIPVVDTGSPARGNEVVTSIGERNVDRTVHYHNYTLNFDMSEKTAVYFQGLYTETDYEEGVALYDLNTFRTTAGFAFRPLTRTSFFGEVYYGQTATEPNFATPKNPHSDFVGGFIGARGRFTEKLGGVVKVGYQERWFSDGADAPGSPVTDVSLSYAFSDKTSMSLSYARVHDVSVQFARESYVADQINAQVNQALGNSGKWFASLGGGYGIYDYGSSEGSVDRNYDRYSVNFNLAYRIQVWLSANLGYSFESINSDSAGVSAYDVNRAILSLAIGY